MVVSLHPSPFPLRSVALLPALPDVFLRVPREVEVQSPVRLPLGDRGHFRPRDTPHITCEGDGDVVGVVTPLRGVAQVVLHGVQVVEVGVRLRVHQDRGVEEDGEGQVEVEREEGGVKERRSCMKMG